VEFSKVEYGGAAAKWIAVGLGVFILLVAAFWPDKLRGLGKRQPPSKEFAPPPAAAPAMGAAANPTPAPTPAPAAPPSAAAPPGQ
jgi:hypothetical protein